MIWRRSLSCPPQSPGAWALSPHWSPAAIKALADAVKAGAVGWKPPTILSRGSTEAAMVSDRQARIAEIEEQIDMLDAEALRFLLDGFLGARSDGAKDVMVKEEHDYTRPVE